MKEIVKKLLLNGISVFTIKFSSIIISIFVANRYTAEEFSIYSLEISYLVVLATTFFNITSQNFSSTKAFNFRNINLFFVSFHLILSSLIALFLLEIENLFFYASLLIIVLSTLKNSEYLHANKHQENLNINLISFSIFLVLLLYAYFMKPTFDIFVIVYAIPYFVLSIFSIRKVAYSIKYTKINFKKSTFKKWYASYISTVITPLGLSVVYTLVKNDGNLVLIGGFFSIFQWFFLFGQINNIMGNVLIRNGNSLNHYKTVLLSCMPTLLILPFILVGVQYHSSIFNISLAESDIKESVFYLSIFTFISAYKSHVARNIIKKSKQELSLYSNVVWLIILITSYHIFGVNKMQDLAMIIFISSFFSTLIFFPIYLKHNLIYIRDRNSIIVTLILFIFCTFELAIFNTLG